MQFWWRREVYLPVTKNRGHCGRVTPPCFMGCLRSCHLPRARATEPTHTQLIHTVLTHVRLKVIAKNSAQSKLAAEKIQFPGKSRERRWLFYSLGSLMNIHITSSLHSRHTFENTYYIKQFFYNAVDCFIHWARWWICISHLVCIQDIHLKTHLI